MVFKKVVEGVEDSMILVIEDLKNVNLMSCDVVVGIVVSGCIFYVCFVIEYVKLIGCVIVGVICNFNLVVMCLL